MDDFGCDNHVAQWFAFGHRAHPRRSGTIVSFSSLIVRPGNTCATPGHGGFGAARGT
jgi:hypothetical protein